MTGIVARDKIRLVKKLTNRDLVRVFKVSLTQIKRWAVICLGRDPEADQSGGVRREYTIDEVFLIYFLGMILVGDHGMTLKEAKTHIDYIKPQLISEKLLPSNFDHESPLKTLELIPLELRLKAKNKAKEKDIKAQKPFINLTIFSENQYIIEWGIFSYLKDINGKKDFEMDSIRKYFPGEVKPFDMHFGHHYVINLDAYLESFMELITLVIK